MPSFEINIKTTDDVRGVQNTTEETIKLTDAMGKLLERAKKKEEYAAAKEAISGLSTEEKEAALAAYKMQAAQEQANRTMHESDGSARGATGAIGGLKTSWMEIYGAIGVAKEVWAAAQQVWTQTAGEFINIAAAARTLSETTGATAEEASTLIAIGDDLKISAESIQTAFEAAIRKGFEPSTEGLRELSRQYQAIQDPIERTKFLMDTFGRSGADLKRLMELDSAALTDMAAAARDSGQVMSQQQLDMARNFEIAEDNLNDAWLKMKLQAGNVLLPVVTDIINADLKRNEVMKEQHKWYLAIPGVAQIYTAVLAGQEKQTRENTAANNELNGSLATTDNLQKTLTSRGNINTRANVHNPGAEGYNPSGYVWTDGRAAGGPVVAGRMYSINENRPWNGPEYFVAPTDGTIVPGSGMPGSGGGRNIEVNLNYSPGISLADRKEAEQVLVPYIKAALRQL